MSDRRRRTPNLMLLRHQRRRIDSCVRTIDLVEISWKAAPFFGEKRNIHIAVRIKTTAHLFSIFL